MHLLVTMLENAKTQLPLEQAETLWHVLIAPTQLASSNPLISFNRNFGYTKL